MSRGDLTATKSRTTGDWTHRDFADGTEQWLLYLDMPLSENPQAYVLERVVKRGSLRPDWCIVKRPEGTGNVIYPEAEAGPFTDPNAGRAALLLMIKASR